MGMFFVFEPGANGYDLRGDDGQPLAPDASEGLRDLLRRICWSDSKRDEPQSEAYLVRHGTQFPCVMRLSATRDELNRLSMRAEGVVSGPDHFNWRQAATDIHIPHEAMESVSEKLPIAGIEPVLAGSWWHLQAPTNWVRAGEPPEPKPPEPKPPEPKPIEPSSEQGRWKFLVISLAIGFIFGVAFVYPIAKVWEASGDSQKEQENERLKAENQKLHNSKKKHHQDRDCMLRAQKRFIESLKRHLDESSKKHLDQVEACSTASGSGNN